MDNSQINEIDLRQSPQWAECLKLYGWKSLETSAGIRMQLMSNLMGGLVKVQKPANLCAEDLVEIETLAKKHRSLLVLIEPSQNQNMEVLKSAGYFTSGFILTPAKTLIIDLQKNSVINNFNCFKSFFNQFSPVC